MIRPSFACVSEHIKGTEDKPDTDFTDLSERWVYIFRTAWLTKWGVRGEKEC